MVATTKNRKRTSTRACIGLPLEINANLETVCERRGWSKVTAVNLMTKKELSQIEAEEKAKLQSVTA